MVSVVIPHWPLNEGLDELLQRCLTSLQGPYEFIVVVNDGIGFGLAANRGLKLAHGEYIAVVNNDTELAHGKLEDLCIKDGVGVPKDQNGGFHPGPFFCMARSVYERVGGFDEQFKVGYWEDNDMIRRWVEHSIPVVNVKRVQIQHLGGTTMRELDTRNEIAKRNEKLFREKWND